MRHDPPCDRPVLPRAPQARPTPESGYSLIEVLAAAAIMAGVLIAIMTMFVYGGQSVNSGKMMTRATSVASDVLEQFRELGFRQTYQVIEDAGNPAVDTRYVWNSDTNAPNAPTDASYVALLAEWKQLAEGDADRDPPGLPRGKMTITVRGLRTLGVNPTEETFNNSKLIQVVVTVKWIERRRQRSVVFETIRG
jgi:type II secretory pathway pseudopilin PulG